MPLLASVSPKQCIKIETDNDLYSHVRTQNRSTCFSNVFNYDQNNPQQWCSGMFSSYQTCLGFWKIPYFKPKLWTNLTSFCSAQTPLHVRWLRPARGRRIGRRASWGKPWPWRCSGGDPRIEVPGLYPLFVWFVHLKVCRQNATLQVIIVMICHPNLHNNQLNNQPFCYACRTYHRTPPVDDTDRTSTKTSYIILKKKQYCV